jgi:hypothetical protein
LKKTKGGYTFPGISMKTIEKALERKKQNVKPPQPKIIGTSMDSESQVSILFDQEMMWPDNMSQKFWDLVMVVEVKSNTDDSITTGFFN